jgi:hypothetical protein
MSVKTGQAHYFQAFAETTEPHLPASLARELATVITIAVEATTPYRR